MRALIAALVATGFVAHLVTGSLLLTALLALLGFAGIGALARARRDSRRTAMLLEESSARAALELKRLADEVWRLQESEQRLREMADALGDLVVVHDEDGRILEANAAFVALTRCQPETIRGMMLADLCIEFADAGTGRHNHAAEVSIATPHGRRWYSWIELSRQESLDGRAERRVVARDITAHRETEAALTAACGRSEQASKAKSRFLATVSHEIRTPMNGIIGMAKLLADTELQPEQQTYVSAVTTSATALLALIEDLLDYSKIEVGRIDLDPRPVQLREMVQNVVELLAARAYSKGIAIGCHVAPDVPETVMADPYRLRQVLLNLVGNAVKFTETGGVLVAATTMPDTQRLAIRIDDTGPGIGSTHLARIFGEFEQVDSSSTRRHGGAGLGLAISQKIAQAMGGGIEVSSVPGAGSSFVLDLPMEEMRAAEGQPDLALAGQTILVLAPEAEARAIEMTLAAHGAEVIVAADVEDASSPVEARDGVRLAAVLVDADMEEAGGLLLKRLSRHGVRAELAVILVAPAQRGRLVEFRGVGYARFLARPVRCETLLRVLLSPIAQETAPTRTVKQRRRKHSAEIGLSILVAEDNEINALLARSALEKAGHRVSTVGDGRAAVEAFCAAGAAYDLVLMDLHMPVMDGLDAISQIRRGEESRGRSAVPILVLTADSQETTRSEVIAHGADGLLTKPLDPDRLCETVASFARKPQAA